MFGEIGLLCDCKRTASVRSKGESAFAFSIVSFLEKVQFLELLDQFPEAALKIKVGLKKYQDVNKSFKKECLRQLDICTGLSNDIIEELSYGMMEEFYEQGTFIMRYGDTTHKIIFLADGTLLVSIKIENQDIDIDYLFRGCWIGLYGALMKFPSGIQCIGETPINAYSISIKYFEDLMPFIPEL
jgi:CRP-like cAMP-binding protein